MHIPHSKLALKSSFFALAIFSVLFIFVSCNSSKDTAVANTKDVNILEAYQTVIVSGANGIKGKRISFSLLKKEGITLDSIQYESYYQPINLINTIKDTLFVDAYFYPIRKANPTRSSLDLNTFQSNDCTLFYHTSKKTKSVLIQDLKIVTDNTKWK